MSKKSNNTYRVVDSLPGEAMTVKAYADSWPCNNAYLYKLWKMHQFEGKVIPFEIVSFKGINFVIPSSLYSSTS